MTVTQRLALNQYWHVILLGVIVILGIGLRLYSLGGVGLHGDEIFTVLESLSPGRVFLSPTNWLIQIASVVSNEDAVLRLPFVIAGVLSIPAIYLLGAQLFGKIEGLAAAFLLAISPFSVYYSRYVRYYALIVLFAILATYFLYRAIEKNRLWDWAGFTLITTLGIYNVSAGFLPLLSLAVFAGLVLTFDRHTPFLKRFLPFAASLSVIVLLSAPSILNASQSIALPRAGNFNADELEAADRPSAWAVGATITVENIFQENFSWPYIVKFLRDYGGGSASNNLAYISAAFFVIGLAACGIQRQWRQFLLAILCVFLPFVTIYFLPLRGLRVYLTKHFIFVLPLYLVFLGRGLTTTGTFLRRVLDRPRPAGEQHPGKFQAGGWLASSFIIAALLLIGVWNLRYTWANYLNPNREFERSIYDYPLMIHYYSWQMTRFLEQNVQPGDAVIFSFDYRWNPDTILNYYGMKNLSNKATIYRTLPPQSSWSLGDLSTRHSRIWLVGELEPLDEIDSDWPVQVIRKVNTIRRVPVYLLEQSQNNQASDQEQFIAPQIQSLITEKDPVPVESHIPLHIEAERAGIINGAGVKYGENGLVYVTRYIGGDLIDTNLHFNDPGQYHLSLRAKNSQPGPVELGVLLNGRQVGKLSFDSNDNLWKTQSMTLPIPQAGAYRLQIAFINPYYGASGDRFAHLDWLEIRDNS